MSGEPAAEDAREQATGATFVDREHPGRIELSLPIEPEPRSLARLAVSALASSLDFSFEEVEDLRLAIDELCTSCATGASRASRLDLCFEREDDALRVECVVDQVTAGAATSHPDGSGDLDDLGGIGVDDLSRMILAELVDSFEIEPVVDGKRRGYFEKRRATASD